MHRKCLRYQLTRPVFLTAALALLMTSYGFAQGQVADDIARSFQVKGRTLVMVKNVDGRIRIISGTQPEVNIRASKEVLRAGSQDEARRAAAEVEIRLEQFGNRVEIEAKYPKQWNFFGLKPKVLVHFEVVAPAASDLEVRNVDGSLTAEGFDGHIDLVTVDGSLTARQCSGTIAARTVDGSLELRNVHGDISARTTDGKLSMDGVFQTLEAQSTDGSIDITVEPGSKMGGEWTVRSTDGSINIELPKDFSADLEARAGDGQIKCDYPVTISGSVDKHRLIGKINGGGSLLKVQSSDGSINITKF
jgi:DUF4097 and DUF4098 domain-containing protein YvlB